MAVRSVSVGEQDSITIIINMSIARGFDQWLPKLQCFDSVTDGGKCSVLVPFLIRSTGDPGRIGGIRGRF